MLSISTYFVLLFTLQTYLHLRQAPSFWLLCIWGLLFFILLFFRKRFYLPQDHPHYVIRKQHIFYSCLLLLLLSIAHLYLPFYLKQHSQSVLLAHFLARSDQELPFQVSGEIDSPVQIDGNRVRFTLKVSQLNEQLVSKQEKVMVTRYVEDLRERDRFAQLYKHDRWSGMVIFKQPDPNRNPGGFNYRQFLAEQEQIYVTAQVVQSSWQRVENHSWSSFLARLLEKPRLAWLNHVETLFSEQSFPLVQAITLGYREALTPEIRHLYQDLGIVHLLAISGLHIGILLWGIYWLLSLLPLTREKITSILLLFIPCYIYLCGAPPSVVRAGLMAMAAMLCIRFQIWKHSLLILYFIYVATLFYQPYWLFHVGYQLSFLVSFFLIIGYAPLSVLLQRLPLGFNRLVAVALLAELASLPLILYHFHQFPPFAFLINVCVVPLFSFFIIPASFSLPIIHMINQGLANMGVYVYQFFLDYLHSLLLWLHQLPYATLHVGRPSFVWFLFYLLICLLWFVGIEKKKLLQFWLALFCILLLFLIQGLLPYIRQEAIVTILDVGQGDAILIELPYREGVILIDMGGQPQFYPEEWMKRINQFEVGRDVLLPYLRYRGINQIDQLILTHGHYDHFGGIQGILGKVKIKQMIRPPIAAQSSFEEEWMAKIEAEGIPVYFTGRGEKWSSKHSMFQILFPQKGNLDQVVHHLHDYNLVIWNQIYQTTLLWTGDVEKEGEWEIRQNYPNLRADILKIAHHGSQTSSTEAWLQQLSAKVGIISVGRNNRFGHPHAEVLERLEEHQLQLYRTDQHGAVIIRILPASVQIRSTLQAVAE